MRLAFMGTPEFAVPSLAELVASGHDIAAVYSQPPKPRGRGMVLTPSPVHTFAESMGLEVRTPTSMKDPAEIEAFRALDLDAAVVVAYGQILLADVLEAPALGCFNVHASLLPRWRGAAPIQRAIMAGDRETAVQVMRMTEGLDEGPVLNTQLIEIEADDTAATLSERLSRAGASLVPRTLAAVERGGIVETPQVGEPTYARKIRAAEARIDWRRPAREIDFHIRGLSPFPGAWFEIDGVRVKALMSRLADGRGAPGEVLDGGLKVACGDGAVRLLRIQREGKGAQTAEVFLNGFPVAPGSVVG